MNPFNNAINELFKIKTQMFRDDSFFEDIECPKCKTRLSDFTDTSFVGCANCYKVFREAVRQSAFRYHGRVEHLGKIPALQIDRASKMKEIERLEKQKAQCVATEDYEQANVLKKKIDLLRSELK